MHYATYDTGDDMIIAVDFDGTIVEHAFPGIGPELPEAVSVLKNLQAAGHKIILWTCRSDRHLTEAVQWLQKRDFKPDAINESIKTSWLTDPGSSRKVYADIYIDDRNLNNKLHGVDWRLIKQQICEIEIYINGER